MRPETKLVNQIFKTIREVCAEGQGYFIKIHGSAYQVSGIPDIVGVYRGRFIALEVKTDTGEVSRRQVLIMARIKKAGGIARVVTSAREVRTILEEQDDR
jgi:hypothetical protein